MDVFLPKRVVDGISARAEVDKDAHPMATRAQGGAQGKDNVAAALGCLRGSYQLLADVGSDILTDH
jgi:hypothetical protein